MNKTIIIVLIAFIVILGGYFLFNRDEPPQITSSTPSSGGSQEENTIIYTDAGFSPAELKIKKGDVVTFKNQSTRSMWPASAMHPTHNVYPTTGGCIGSTFDACKGVQPSESWSFQFDIAGNWKYHNHLNSTEFGAVIVE